MVDTLTRTLPLEGRIYGGNAVSISPAEQLERISLRSDKSSMKTLGSALGLDLPKKSGAIAESDGIACLWLGPDEWLVLGDEGTDIEGKINAVTGLFSAVSVSHRNTGISISGANAVNALNGGCPRDLSLEAFPIGTCSRTILGKAEIVLWRKSQDTFHVECWRSFSDYVWKFLAEAARNA